MKKVQNYIANLIFVIILIPLLYIAVSLAWQAITQPEQIPNIFGYKLFMILDRNMVNVEYGDLVFTKNINQNELNVGDTVAFRDIRENKVQIIKYNNEGIFGNIEGLLIKRIPKVGSVLYFIQKPIVMITISAIILAVGGVIIFIAGKLDERDERRLNVSNSKS